MLPAATRRLDSLLALPRGAKKALAVMTDAALCVITVWLAICFRFESWVSLSGYQWLAVMLSVLLAIPLLTAFGFYHTVIRFAGKQTIAAALRAIGIYAVIYSAVFTAYGFPLVPRTIGILQPLLLLIGLALIRLLASQLLGEQISNSAKGDSLPAVLIYGAGNSGQQLAASLQAKGDSRVVGFLDNNPNIQKARISGVPVYSPDELGQLIAREPIQNVLLAMPGLARSRRNEIIRLLSNYRVAVRTLPSLSDLAQGKFSEGQLRELDIEDLLGRDPVAPIEELLSKNITNKVVLITGAGGSIGSELCRQISKLSPFKLVMIDHSEFALYTIHQELQLAGASSNVQLAPILANVQDEIHIEHIFRLHRPHTVYHAAAYKHVPMVESNPVAGLQNNVLGTLCVTQAAMKLQVENMVLISTDKAVRPTNVMGAAKRTAEMCLQALASHAFLPHSTTKLCVVRFGNVLGSSGSVVPMFRSQIQQGKSITVTHKEVTRYFMTISEAAQLVIQAAAMPSTSPDRAEIFLLDMGSPVKILELARSMIELSGLTVRNTDNPAGDISIEITGLRPGEKLYEELLIGMISEETVHPKIKRGIEQFMPWDELSEKIQSIKRFTPGTGFSTIAQFLTTVVPEYTPEINTNPLLKMLTSKDQSDQPKK
jgi:FlaA1/EpsC-like NDP-sugar epimerase